MLVAGLFLKEFIDPQIPWLHLDIAGPAFNTGKAHGYIHINKTATAIGIASNPPTRPSGDVPSRAATMVTRPGIARKRRKIVEIIHPVYAEIAAFAAIALGKSRAAGALISATVQSVGVQA
ncbi:MAG: hypothetical protein ACKOFA_01180 [Rhodoluna sp.]